MCDAAVIKDFFRISEGQSKALKSIVRSISVPSGSMVMKEGDVSDCLYLLVHGSVAVSRTDHSAADDVYKGMKLNNEFEFKEWAAGSIVGETGYFDSKKRTQTITASSDSLLYEIKYDDIKKTEETDPQLFKSIILALSVNLAGRIRDSNAIVVGKIKHQLIEYRKRSYFTSLLLRLMVITCGFLLIFEVLKDFYQSFGSLTLTLTTSVILSFMLLLVFYTRERPASRFFGITTLGWRVSLYEGVLLSAALCLFATLGKYFYIQYFGLDLPLFHPIDSVYSAQFWIALVLYSVFSFPQELLARGMIQRPFEYLLSGKHGVLSAILISNLIFTALHVVNFSLTVCALVFFTGVLWGWLYSRHETLVGVVASHILTGVFVIFFLGISFV
jgi:CRP-like cAMP-binding protein